MVSLKGTPVSPPLKCTHTFWQNLTFKDEAVKGALDQQKEEFSIMKSTNIDLQTQLKELQSSYASENINELKEKISSQNIDLASLRVELKRAEGDKQTANKKAHAEIDMERAQVCNTLCQKNLNCHKTGPNLIT